MTDLGTLPGYQYGGAEDINDSGQVVGLSCNACSYAYGTEHAFLYSNGTMTDLGTLPGTQYSWAARINNSGQVIGTSFNVLSNSGHGFLYTLDNMNLKPSTPSLISPLKGAVDVKPNNVPLQWAPSTDPEGDAIEYCITVKEQGTPNDVPVFSGCDQNSFTPNNTWALQLEPNKEYWWAVWAKDSKGAWSEASEWWNFTTMDYSWASTYSLPFDYASNSHPNEYSLYAVVNNCRNDPDHFTYTDEWGVVLINTDQCKLLKYFAELDQFYGVVAANNDFVASPHYDYTWNNDVRNEFSNDDRFNTVYKVSRETLNPSDNLEVISCTDDFPQPVFRTWNRSSYFFTYDSKTDPPFGNAIGQDDWVNYLKAIKKYYNDHPINTLTITAHGTGFTYWGNQPEIKMSEAFTFKKPLFTTDENTKNAFQQLREILAPNATILIFSCFVGSGPEGRQFVQDIANWTGACVYANSDATGDKDYKIIGSLQITGDWQLDVHKCPEEIGPISIQNLQAPLDGNSNQEILLPGGVMIQLPNGSLTSKGTLILSDVTNSLNDLGVDKQNYNIIRALDISLKGTTIANQYFMQVSLPYGTQGDSTPMTVKYWDSNLRQWLDTGLTNINQNIADGYLTFNTNHTTIFAALVNQPPTAICHDVTVAAGSSCTASASINNGSYDPDGDSITLAQSPAGPYQKGNTSVMLTVTNSRGASSQCTGTVTVSDNTPPSVTAPAAVTAYTGPSSSLCGIGISSGSLGMATASDNCSSVTVTASGIPSSSLFPVGTTAVTYTAKDGAGNLATGTQTVTVIDSTPPSITKTSANPSDLWPPNHKMVNVSINYNASDNCNLPTCQIASVTSNQPINRSDYTILDAHHIRLLAENDCEEHGKCPKDCDHKNRIYTINITCKDTAGNSSSKAVAVSVPHDQGKK